MRSSAFLLVCVLVFPAIRAQGSCWSDTKSDAASDLKSVPHGVEEIPHGIKRHAKVLIPVAAATLLLIETNADQKASRQVTSPSLISKSNTASNIGLYSEFGTAGALFLAGCHNNTALRGAGFHVLESMGYAVLTTEALKVAFNRSRPDRPGLLRNDSFWDGGSSFPSGHAAMSWAFAAAMARQFPHNKWVKIGSYSTAAVVSGLRFSAKKHYPSDILIGGVEGYAIGHQFGR
ncbi:MAG: phosphatase PAP2 family protein [Acidobacteria bacterium]|nr:phosphatase PAP2 family protein [Acidobacteriaceae bacterium]MBV9609622.1 phosphatase PAP2 family protein [Acidobacteriota bacterium]